MKRVILSIKPVFAEKIFSGDKRFEFRRTIFARSEVKTVLIYATSPCRQIVGEFIIDAVITMSPNRLWQQTKHRAGIDKQQFDEYFNGKATAYALKISSPRRFRVPLNLLEDFGVERPPQSFCYVPEDH
jgi:predicted transcriptional regulator